MKYEQTSPGHVLIVDMPPLVYFVHTEDSSLSAARHNLSLYNVFSDLSSLFKRFSFSKQILQRWST